MRSDNKSQSELTKKVEDLKKNLEGHDASTNKLKARNQKNTNLQKNNPQKKVGCSIL